MRLSAAPPHGHCNCRPGLGKRWVRVTASPRMACRLRRRTGRCSLCINLNTGGQASGAWPGDSPLTLRHPC